MRVLASITITLALAFFGLIYSVIVGLATGKTWLGLFTGCVVLGIIIFINLVIFGQGKKKMTKRVFLAFATVCLLVVISNFVHGKYMKSLEVVSTQDVNLEDYQPFVPNTKVAKLEEESTYKIEAQLPRLDGSTALYPMFASFVQAVYPEKEYPLDGGELVSSQTSFAFELLLKGNVDIAFMPKPSDKQQKAAERAGIELEYTPIGKEAFVFFVNEKNPVDQLTIEQIQGIYAGEIENWKEVGGNNEEIKAFQRPEESGSQTALIRLMGDKKIMTPPTDEIVSAMGGIIEMTSNYLNYRNSIGFSFRYFSQDMVQNGNIKHLAVEGIQPTRENIQNGSYPITSEIYAVTAQSKNSHVQPFIEWILSEQGQYLIEKTGYTPIN